MAAPDPERAVDPAMAMQYDAVKMFVDRAQATQTNFTLTRHNSSAVAQICQRLDGLPLAIELAAARVRLLEPGAILDRLSSRLGLLTTGPRDAPVRHQTLRATIAWSYELLAPSEQRLFERLGAFVGGCTLEAAEAVANADGQLGSSVLDCMGALVDKSLLQRLDGFPGEPRFGLLETIREFALEQLVASGEADEFRGKHADYFIELGERAALELQAGPEHVRWIDRMALDKYNLRAALVWCVGRGEVERGLQLGGAVSNFWYLLGSLAEARDWQQALQRLFPGAARTMHLARAMNGAGGLSIYQSDFSTAKVLYEQSLTIERELDDHAGISTSLSNLADLAMREGDSGLARRLLEEAVTESRSVVDLRTHARALNLLGGALADLGDYPSACVRHGESAAIYLELGDKSRAASALSRQGSAARSGDDFVSAEELCQESLRLARESGDRSEIGWSYLHLAFVRLHQADYTDAQELFALCIPLWDGSVSAQHRIALAVQGLASIAASLGQAERAMRLFGAAEPLDRALRPAGLPNSFGFTTHLSTIRWRALASRDLGEQATAEALSSGRAMPVADAVAYALQPSVGPASASFESGGLSLVCNCVATE